MAVRELNDNILVLAPKILDARYGPHLTTANAIAYIPWWRRREGLTVGIRRDGNPTDPIVEYWWRDGILDEHLVPKTYGEFVDHVFAVLDPIYPVQHLYYSKGGVDTYIVSIPFQDGLLFGGYVTWSGTGLIYNVTPALYILLAELYQYPGGSVQLAPSDPDFKRIDLVVLTNNETVEVITGTPAFNPIRPQHNPQTQLPLTTIDVFPNTLTPVLPTGIVYDENTGSPAEFNGSSTAPGLVFNAIVQPYRETYHINSGSMLNGYTITFAHPDTRSTALYETFSFQMWLLASMSNQHNLYVTLLMNGSPVGTEVLVALNKSLTGAYQSVVVGVNTLSASSVDFNGVRFRWVKSGPNTVHNGFYMDYIKFEGGIVPPIIASSIQLYNEVTANGYTGTPIDTRITPTGALLALSPDDIFFVREHATGILRALTWQTLIDEIGGSGTDGRTPELRIDGSWVQWKYTDDVDWINLFLIPLDGIDGDDGRTPELRIDSGWVQWKYVDEVSWTNLFQIPADGLPGADGDNAYVYIAYASDALGTGFTMTFDPLLDYIAIKSTNVEIATPQASDFTGLWKNYKGVAGAPGTPGTNGASAFVYIAYASDDTGTGFTLTFDPALNYIAIKATTTEIVTPVVGDFTGLWKNYKGADGSGGGGGGGHTIKDTDGTALTQRDTLKFKGYLTATDNALSEETEADIPEEKIEEVELVEVYQVPFAAQVLLEDVLNWTGKVYSGSEPSSCKAGMRHHDADYVYEFVTDTIPIRYIRS